MRPGKERKTLAFRKGTSMSEWYALQIESGIVTRACRLPDDLGDADKPAAQYLQSLPMIDPAPMNRELDQFFASDTAQPIGRKALEESAKKAPKKRSQK